MAKLYSNLSEIAAGSEQAVKNALLQTAADVVSIAKQLAPVDTGALKQSIGAIPETSTSILIGSDKEYAPFVEYGTVNSPAQPFLTPAFAQAESAFKVRLAQEMQKLANK